MRDLGPLRLKSTVRPETNCLRHAMISNLWISRHANPPSTAARREAPNDDPGARMTDYGENDSSRGEIAALCRNRIGLLAGRCPIHSEESFIHCRNKRRRLAAIVIRQTSGWAEEPQLHPARSVESEWRKAPVAELFVH